MLHAISAALACLAARARDYHAQRDHDTAAIHGWEVHEVTPGTYRYRDPRFDQRTALGRSPASVTADG